jgi:hypothetical protein
MRFKIQVEEIDRKSVQGIEPDQTIYTQVVDTNPIKAIQTAIAGLRSHRKKGQQGILPGTK